MTKGEFSAALDPVLNIHSLPDETVKFLFDEYQSLPYVRWHKICRWVINYSKYRPTPATFREAANQIPFEEQNDPPEPETKFTSESSRSWCEEKIRNMGPKGAALILETLQRNRTIGFPEEWIRALVAKMDEAPAP